MQQQYFQEKSEYIIIKNLCKYCQENPGEVLLKYIQSTAYLRTYHAPLNANQSLRRLHILFCNSRRLNFQGKT
jgi:hypothetical protein